MQVQIAELTEKTLSRRRGKEAYDALVSRDDHDEIVIDLNGAEACSLSFLDELVCRMHGIGMLQRASFVTGNPQHIRKLGRVSAIRELTIYRMIDGKRELVEPVSVPPLIEIPSDAPPPDDMD
ncbi:MAG: hypothetical protein ACOC8E_04210 [Planctomycetota bacterium]